MRATWRLALDEHYILKNIRTFIGQYLLLWVIALGIGGLAYFLVEVECDPMITKVFGTSVVTLSITTITFALPTCMRTIFAAYEGYHSSTIRSILMMRFPITLLSLSSFTSLIVSLLVVSGVLGIYWALPSWSVLAFMAFWALVCVFYLFVAIEKLVHFVVNAPEAVLNMLEFSVFDAKVLKTDEEYAAFRQSLSSMSDISATIIRKSTGKDTVISKYLEQLRDIHRHFAKSGIEATDDIVRNRHLKACTACGKELTKLYREAVGNNNGEMTRSVLKSYSIAVKESIEVGCSRDYLAHMLSQAHRFQSYAQISLVDEIREQASFGWFFILLFALEELETDHTDRVWHVKHCIVREMLTSLCDATKQGKTELVVGFMRVASNSDLEVDLRNHDPEWLALIDRVVLLYLNWLLIANLEDAKDYLGLLRRHSLDYGGTRRSLFCDSPARLDELLRLERFDAHLADKSEGFRKRELSTVALTDLPHEKDEDQIDATRLLCYLVEIAYLEVDDGEVLRKVPRLQRLCLGEVDSQEIYQGFEQAIQLAQLACPTPDDLRFDLLELHDVAAAEQEIDHEDAVSQDVVGSE